MLKHWKRYLITFTLVTGLAVAPVAMAQDATPEPAPIGGDAPSEIPTPGDVTNTLVTVVIAAFVAIVGSAFPELVIGVLRYVPFLDVVSDDVLKGIVSGVGIILYIVAGTFGFTGQFTDVTTFLQQFLPLLSGVLGLFAGAPKVRQLAARNRWPVLQQASIYRVQRAA